MNGLDFIRAVKSLAKERGISEDEIFEYMETALHAAFKKNNNATNSKVKIDRETGEIKVVAYKVVVDEINMEDEEDAQILLEELGDNPNHLKVGDVIEEEVTPKDFGRVAASTAKQVVTQKIREAERNSIMEEFADKEGEMMVGFLAMEDSRNYYVDLGRARGILPKSEMIPGETVKMGTSIKVYITKIESTTKGPLILLSRKHYGFVKRLFESEIPELADGTIELYSVIREPGIRSKVAVYSTNERVDAIGACIGEKGSRIGSILKELNGEKVDLILYSENPQEFIQNALAPAKNIIVNILDETKKEALAIVPEDQLSLAIGKKGTNVKLASRLTKYKIEVKTLNQINEDGNK